MLREYETTILLSDLSEFLSRSTFRSQFFHAGVFLVIVFGFVTILVLPILIADGSLGALQLFFPGLTVLGIMLCAAFARRIEMVTFTNRQRLALLSIFGTAKHKQKLAHFTGDILDAIRNQSEATNQP